MKVAFFLGTTGKGGLELNHINHFELFQENGIESYFVCIENSPVTKILDKKEIKYFKVKKHKNHLDYLKAYKLYVLLKKLKITHLITRSNFDLSIIASVKVLFAYKLKHFFVMEMQMNKTKKQWYRTLRYMAIDFWICPLNYLKVQVDINTNFNKKNIRVIPSYIKDQEKKTKTHRYTFGVLGRIEAYKGQRFAIEALHILHQEGYKANLLIQGEKTINENDTYFDDVISLISKFKLKDFVYIKPFNDDIQTFFSEVSCTLMTSKNETIGMVTLESLANETPVVGSNKGGTVEILKNSNGGLLFESENIIDLKNKMIEMIDNQFKFDYQKTRLYLEKNNEKYYVDEFLKIL